MHVNKAGSVVHGRNSEDASKLPWGPKCSFASTMSFEARKNIMDLLKAGWTVPQIFDNHCRAQFGRQGEDRGADVSQYRLLSTFDGRDDLITKADLYNLRKIASQETWMLDNNDQVSLHKWILQNPERVVFHTEYVAGPPEIPFQLCLQSPWQRTLMIELTHGCVLAMDSTFATNKYKV